MGGTRSARPGGPAPGEARRGRARPRTGRSSTFGVRLTGAVLYRLSYQRSAVRASNPWPPRWRRGALPTELTAQHGTGRDRTCEGLSPHGALAERCLASRPPFQRRRQDSNLRSMGCSHLPCRLATPSYGAPGIRTQTAVIPPLRFSRPAPCRSANAPQETALHRDGWIRTSVLLRPRQAGTPGSPTSRQPPGNRSGGT